MFRRWRVLGLILGVIVKMRAILVKKSREKMKLYCCLFPNEYEFERETLVRLWMAMGFSSLSCAENFCEEYFDILVEEWYIVFSSIDTVTRRKLFKVDHQGKDNTGEKKTINRGDLYTVLEDEDANGSKLGHISVASNCINETTFKELQNFDGELRTLLFIHNYGSTFNKIPSDLFLTLEFLRALDLSGNDIVELPRSIGNVSQLRYLDLSFTLIESLPKSIDQLHQLQTLKLQGCRHLHELPKGIIELICLQHLDLDVLGQLTSLPKGIGALTELCTLSAFIVDSDEGCTIKELKFLNKLRGSLCISGLEKVAHVDDVQEAALQDKKYVTHLQLRWSDLVLYSIEDKQLGYNIIASLNLNKGLQDLQIACYPGLNIPAWFNFREQQNLLSISLLNCNNNDLSLPLGQLPNLKYLTIIHMNRVRKTDNWFHGGGDEAYVAFPKLESLKIECMLSLETWIDVCNHNDFPFLTTLIIKQCPKLIRLPFLSHFQVLKFLEISHCTVFTCLPEGTLPASLETLVIDDCPFLKKSCSKEGEDWHKVEHISNIWIDLQNICSNNEDDDLEDSTSKSEDICSTDEVVSEDFNLSADIRATDEDVSEDINLSAVEAHMGGDDIEVADEYKQEFSCPFCTEEFDIVGLFSHMDEEHHVESKAGVCPVCASRVGLDLVSHMTLQHENVFKIQSRRRLHRGVQNPMFSILRKELREGNRQSQYGGFSFALSPFKQDPAPLFTSLMHHSSTAEEVGKEEPLSSKEEDSLPPSVEPTSESSQHSGLSVEEYEEKARKCEFVQGLLLPS